MPREEPAQQSLLRIEVGDNRRLHTRRSLRCWPGTGIERNERLPVFIGGSSERLSDTDSHEQQARFRVHFLFNGTIDV